MTEANSVTFSDVKQTIQSLLSDLTLAHEAHLNGFKIDANLVSMSKQYDMNIDDLQGIDFDK